MAVQIGNSKPVYGYSKVGAVERIFRKIVRNQRKIGVQIKIIIGKRVADFLFYRHIIYQNVVFLGICIRS